MHESALPSVAHDTCPFCILILSDRDTDGAQLGKSNFSLFGIRLFAHNTITPVSKSGSDGAGRLAMTWSGSRLGYVVGKVIRVRQLDISGSPNHFISDHTDREELLREIAREAVTIQLPVEWLMERCRRESLTVVWFTVLVPEAV